jgi:hypothetical protein
VPPLFVVLLLWYSRLPCDCDLFTGYRLKTLSATPGSAVLLTRLLG